MEIQGTSDSRQRARQLRHAMTKPERLLWWALKANQTGHHFRRQHAVGPFVLDFYCDRRRLCVEVDGLSHNFTTESDRRRDAYLQKLGIKTLRIAARDILTDLEGSVSLIKQTADSRPLRQLTLTPPPRERGTREAIPPLPVGGAGREAD